jgi:L-fuconolactonase
VVIDAHLHLWNTERLRYEWLQRPGNAVINRTFGFADFRSRAVAAGVDRAAVLGGTAARFYALGTASG